MTTPRHDARSPTAQALPLRVLVVDDNEINRAQAAALLACWGAQTIEASNGAEAVGLVVDGHEFDLVLMDVQMPVMNGLAATAQIRQLERERSRADRLRLPIVALTSEVLPADESHLRQFGLDAVLSKPLTPTSLVACLARWCPGTVQPN